MESNYIEKSLIEIILLNANTDLYPTQSKYGCSQSTFYLIKS